MRAIKFLVSIIFVIVLGVFIFVKYTNEVDTTIPHIVCDVSVIEASVKDSNNALLKHVSAFDKKDGDLSNKVIVEKISPFVEFGKVNVTFAVCDNDQNVTKLSVPVVYKDYENPKIKLKDDLVFPIGTRPSVKDCIEVTDNIDGDISDRVVVIDDSGADMTTAGMYPITIKVTNSKSYTYSMAVDIIMCDQCEEGYSVKLSDYLIYKKLGENVDYNSYIEFASVPYSVKKDYNIVIDSTEVNPTKPGVYNVLYNQYVDGEKKSESRLIVCYEE